jgi:hypothetical protein
MRSSAIFNAAGLALFVLLLGVTGCNSVGPSTLTRDRLHYSCALSDSWKEQLLVNIVKTRYEDTPAFLEVVSVVSGYTVELGAGVSGQYSPLSLRGDTFYGGGVSGKFTDRPTISYAPMSGEKFARSLMSPVPVEAVWSVLQSGVPADFLLGLTLQSMGGHYWYWIEREDLESKKTLAAVTLLMHFLESGAGKSTPILTIPVN